MTEDGNINENLNEIRIDFNHILFQCRGLYMLMISILVHVSHLTFVFKEMYTYTRVVHKTLRIETKIVSRLRLSILSMSVWCIILIYHFYLSVHPSFCRMLVLCWNSWRAPWKNQISSTTMKLRKSLVKPVTWQKISSCFVLPPEIIIHDAFNVILRTSADIWVVHDDLGCKNRKRGCNRFWRVGCSWLEYVNICLVY